MARQKTDSFLEVFRHFLLRNRLKRYGFKMYNHKGQESIYSPYSILGIGMKELEIKKGFPEHYHWVGPTGGSVERCEDYPLDLSPFANRKIVSCDLWDPIGLGKGQFNLPNEAVS